MGIHEHRKAALVSVRIGILSVSSTRRLEADESGHWISGRATEKGHTVCFHQVVADDITAIRETALEAIRAHSLQALLVTGGTGITRKDVTIEALSPLFSKKLSAFGTIFSQLSYQEIGAAAILSRAAAGIVDETLVFCMPGSRKACELACESLIFPDLGHGVAHVR
ncbi:molybdenum cofactor biosynthesis protein [Desulfosarcina sp. OttesenSCG-928-A07]|nr:molybdenum cofactor biosynthesis protein [Desulfosarcina sp. OttesenSCG-928-G17]MDL2329794.1 molybdenum cofactor biosynthesis protein [Desulfosarcina sp. OttesenSCG-928-A07]